MRFRCTNLLTAFRCIHACMHAYQGNIPPIASPKSPTRSPPLISLWDSCPPRVLSGFTLHCPSILLTAESGFHFSTKWTFGKLVSPIDFPEFISPHHGVRGVANQKQISRIENKYWKVHLFHLFVFVDSPVFNQLLFCSHEIGFFYQESGMSVVFFGRDESLWLANNNWMVRLDNLHAAITTMVRWEL